MIKSIFITNGKTGITVNFEKIEIYKVESTESLMFYLKDTVSFVINAEDFKHKLRVMHGISNLYKLKMF